MGGWNYLPDMMDIEWFMKGFYREVTINPGFGLHYRDRMPVTFC